MPEIIERRPYESAVSFGRRRKADIQKRFKRGDPPEVIAMAYQKPRSYVLEALGMAPTIRYEWRPGDDVLESEPPTFENALVDPPLIAEHPSRMTQEMAIERALQFWDWYRAGLTLQQIADKHGITRERVSKILKRYGLPLDWQNTWKTTQDT
jgi:hypothetical protein